MKLIMVLIALAATTATSTNSCGPFPAGKGRKVMKLYVWDVLASYQNHEVTVKAFPGNPTTPVAGSGWSIYNKLTAVPLYNSIECGRNEGFSMLTSLDLTTINLHLSHRFHGLGYISSAGIFNGTAAQNEAPVSGGIGVFKGAEGCLIIERYGPGAVNNLIRAEIGSP